MYKHLLVLTGFPSSGKTSISEKLENYFVCISTGLLREKIYPNKKPLEIKYPDDWEKIWDEVCLQRNEALYNDENVIIDSCAHTKYIREKFLFLPEDIENVRRKLIILNTDQEEIARREKTRDRNMEKVIDAMMTDYQDPREFEYGDVIIEEYQNNSFGDQENIVKKIIDDL